MNFLRTCLLLLLSVSWALATDVVHLANGTKIEGTIVEQTDDEIIIETDRGERVISWADVIHVEQRGSVADEFQASFDGLRKWDIDGTLELATWCEERDYLEGAHKCYERVIKLDPENRKARRELGYRKYDGAWLTDHEYKLAIGWVEVDGELVSPDVAEKLRRGLVFVDGEWVEKETQRRPRRDREVELVLPEDAKALLHIVEHNKNRQKFEGACEALVAMGGDSFTALVDVLYERVEDAQKDYRSAATSRLSDGRQFLAQELVAARKEALRIIFDTSIYPDENHGAVGQPVVDEAVGKVQAIWDNPFAVLLAENSKLQEARAALAAAHADLIRYANEGPSLEELEAEVATAINEKVNLKGAPINAQDKAIFDHSQRVLAYNAQVDTSVDEQERACIDETNAYRIMMGLRALHIDERLVQAARKHSVDMRSSGFFDHHSPNTGSPADRCRREGASYSGENIAMGSGTGRGAFLQWYNSSGHHRNILTRGHLTIGIGRDHTHWTQNFGMDSVN